MYTTETTRRFTTRLNEHVDQCQVCEKGALCDIAESIIADEEARREQVRKANRERRLKQAGL